ncbi:MAG: cytochrome c [Rhodoferax sp.]|nr:cytochrome c [Rhodoferax sp.]
MSKRLRWYLALAALVALGAYLWQHRFGTPEDFTAEEDEYKYGSIGADHPMAMAPIPYWIFKALPLVVPADQAIEGEVVQANGNTVTAQVYAPRNGKKGLDAFGMVTEASMPPGKDVAPEAFRFDRPIGVSKRTVLGIDLIGFNCSVCHLTTLRRTPGAKQEIVVAGTGNSMDMEQLFLYMFGVIGSDRFTGTAVMDAVDTALKDAAVKAAPGQTVSLSWYERLIYRIFIVVAPPLMNGRKKEYFDFITPGPNRLNTFGPGRVATWAVYKRLYGDPPERTKVQGIVDHPPVWNGRARPAGMQMHWDGNTDVFEERNIISSLAIIGKNIEYMDLTRLNRIASFIGGVLPPRYEDLAPPLNGKPAINFELTDRGAGLFKARCSSCHAPDGIRLGRVEPLATLGTDPERLHDFSAALVNGINSLQTDVWKLRHFKLQSGYVNNLLDGVWLRGPYLHNGSVPNLWELLKKPDLRPKRYCRGSDVVDWENVGYVARILADSDKEGCGENFLYDTAVKGNSNAGHDFGTDLSDQDKKALVEFLKTL